MPRIKVEGIQMEVPQFSEFSEYDANDYGDGKRWHFEASMVSSCEPLFDDCDSNYDVEKKLRDAKVIHPKNQAESETCALWVDFTSVTSANKFIARLNKYLIEKARKLEAARTF